MDETLKEAIKRLFDYINDMPIISNPCLEIPEVEEPDRTAEIAAAKRKYGHNFEPDFTDSPVIGRWVNDKPEKKYRTRWVGGKYVTEEIK